MNYPGLLITLGMAAALTTSAPAAETALKAGVAVVDPSGMVVGTIASVDGDLVVVDTGANKASLPISAFGKGDKAVTIGMSRVQLDAAASEAKAKARAQILSLLTPGVPLYGSDGGALGKVELVEGDYLTLQLADERKAKLPLASVTRGEKGATIAMTAGQFAQAMGPAPTPLPEVPPKP